MLWTDLPSEQLSCGNGTLLCVGTDTGVVKTQNFLQALIMHHRLPSSKGQRYHTVKVYNCIWKVPECQPTYWLPLTCTLWFYSVPPGKCQANTLIRPCRVLQDPFRLIDLPTIWYYITQDTDSFVKQTTKKIHCTDLKYGHTVQHLVILGEWILVLCWQDLIWVQNALGIH